MPSPPLSKTMLCHAQLYRRHSHLHRYVTPTVSKATVCHTHLYKRHAHLYRRRRCREAEVDGGTFSCCVNQLYCSLIFTKLAYGNLTLIGSGPIVAGRTGNDEYLVGMLFEVWARMRLVPQNMSTKTGSETKYK